MAWRRLIGVSAAVLLAAACGSDSEPGARPTTTAVVTTTPAPTTGVDGTTADTGRGPSASCDAGYPSTTFNAFGCYDGDRYVPPEN